MPGTTGVSTEAGMLVSMRRREVIKDSEEHVTVGLSGDKVIADIREFTMSPEVFDKAERRMFVLGHR